MDGEIDLRRDEGGGPGSRLAEWRENVGAPVALDAAEPAAGIGAPGVLVVISWNVWIGRGRIGEVVRRFRDGAWASLGAPPDAPLLLLLQEAFRADASVPARCNGRAGGDLGRQFRPAEEIVETADRLGLALRYAPSMRNRGLRSDRGNAILSSLPLAESFALELPFVLQRRVALGARVAVPGAHELAVTSAHLDPRGPPGLRWLGVAGRALQAERLLAAGTDRARPAVLGADLNLGRGRRELAYRLLERAGFALGVPPRVPLWRHTFHKLPRLLLDYLLLRDPAGAIAGAEVHRLDEHPADAGATVFGSDHHPLLCALRFHPVTEAEA